MARVASVVYGVIFLLFGILYPTYCTLIALETKSTKDDTAWLAYWVIFGLFSITEYFADFILGWFPLYSLLKLGFIVWAVAPIPETGAYYLYKVFVQPFFRMYGGHVDYVITEAIEHLKDASHYIPSYPKLIFNILQCQMFYQLKNSKYIFFHSCKFPLKIP